MRLAVRLLLILVALGLAVAGYAYSESRREAVVRRMSITLPRWPEGALPVRAVLMSDLHLGNASTDEARAARLMDQVNGLNPDLVLIAGDFIAGHDAAEAAKQGAALARVLGRLRAPWGTIAVLGNHDHWTGAAAVRRALAAAHVTVLANEAVEAGPLAIGGLDDAYTHREDVARTAAAMRRLAGARLVLSHSPDVAPRLPRDLPLLLAGHTHCGQVVLPLIGPPQEVASPHYRCGAVRDPGRLTVVTAGLGTSSAPFRLNAPPDLWLLTLGGEGE
ncbi:metallophosphoesterase [Sphingomonas aracearum]|uniref:Phosphohydrolase n=1 Tax=Sphingomonas aracearum TaxID=2283317 RepID=A0A369VR26_9SPHN|nr:metallophosphoesterase [Sphingomonas aracearum]RDE04834.1 phosphohydrolase [Sphingomonas aracearum]